MLTVLPRLCLRRAAFRVLSSSPSSSSISISTKSRPLTTLTVPVLRPGVSRAAFLPIQRRFASEEAATQSETEADGATEAQHGDNSTAASSSDVDASKSTSQPEETTATSTIQSAADTASNQASAAAQQVGDAAQSASESVTGAAASVGQSLSQAAGFANSERESSESSVGEVSKTVYVGNLFFDVRSEDLKKEFERAGPVVDVKIIMDARGLSKGFGYVEFESTEAAAQAISLYNLQNYEGRRLSVQYSLSRAPRPSRGFSTGDPSGFIERPLHPPTKTLFIGNMSFDMSDRDLNNLFREIKNVIDVRVAIDRRTGQPRGFAHADFVDVGSAEKALEELKGKVVCGRPLRVDFSTSTGRAATGATAAAT